MSPAEYEGRCCQCGKRSLYLRFEDRWYCLTCTRQALAVAYTERIRAEHETMHAFWKAAVDDNEVGAIRAFYLLGTVTALAWVLNPAEDAPSVEQEDIL